MDMLSKRDAMLAMLEDGFPVLVAVDASPAGVEVPENFKGSDVILRFGYNLTPGIQDLSLTSEALVGTLTFQGKPFRCVLPWGAVFSMCIENTIHAVTWPRETAVEYEVEIDPEPEEEAPRARHLKLVD